MTSNEVRQKFLKFFENRGHKILPSASLVPENDPSVLFNTAGMQPLVPYLLGQKHPLGNRLVNAQKCVRTGDIEEVGNHKNLTFFEMLGNWSLGDYFKEEAISWSYEFLTSKEEGLGLDPKRLYVTVFEGDQDAPRDIEAVEIWKRFIPENRIYFLPKKNNWWSPGENGPCGPDTEMFYDVTENGLGDMTHKEYVLADDAGQVVEIWNDVFMEYEKRDGKVIGKLSQKNVDTGSGLERITMIVQGKTNVYETDMFLPVMELIKKGSENFNEKSARIVADHTRTALFIMSDGILPGNKDQGYILRRLIRRAVMQARNLNLKEDFFETAIGEFQNIYKNHYPKVADPKLINSFMGEKEKFNKTLEQGLKELDKLLRSIESESQIKEFSLSGNELFYLYESFGFPIELSIEEINNRRKKNGYFPIDADVENLLLADFGKKMNEHQEKSRAGAEQKFKGGLANTNEKTVRLHTAHHLLLKALQEVLGNTVHQRGSNITEERLRIDFSFDRKMTDEEKTKVEEIVNQKIQSSLNVIRREMPFTEAENLGAEMEFGAKYPEVVSVYFIEDENGNVFSKEFCGGPHVNNTNELGLFKIQKEEAVSQGIRRIKATLI